MLHVLAKNRFWIAALALMIGFTACEEWESIEPEESNSSFVQEGIASYYGDQFDGNPTASGEIFDQEALTAAHRTLDFGTRVRVTNQDNGLSVEVRINDRGPFVDGRIIDLSRRAAEEIDMIQAGIVPVRIEVID